MSPAEAAELRKLISDASARLAEHDREQAGRRGTLASRRAALAKEKATRWAKVEALKPAMAEAKARLDGWREINEADCKAAGHWVPPPPRGKAERAVQEAKDAYTLALQEYTTWKQHAEATLLSESDLPQ